MASVGQVLSLSPCCCRFEPCHDHGAFAATARLLLLRLELACRACCWWGLGADDVGQAQTAHLQRCGVRQGVSCVATARGLAACMTLTFNGIKRLVLCMLTRAASCCWGWELVLSAGGLLWGSSRCKAVGLSNMPCLCWS